MLIEKGEHRRAILNAQLAHEPPDVDDTPYVDPEPITGEPYEGNAHAAVFGGEGDYIFGGDEDFSPDSFAISYDGVEYPAGVALFGADPHTLAGNVEYVGGDGCLSVAAPTGAESQVALIDRGACFFSDKGANGEAAGYEGYIVANNSGDDLINMSPGDNAIPTIPGVFIGQSDGDAIKANEGLPVSASSIFDGWGYLHIYNNSGAPITVPSEGRASTETMTVPTGHELGYYAPAEAVGEGLGTDFGDLTLHNIEADPLTQGIVPSFDEGPLMFVSWYSLGMRAVEYRPGHYHDNGNGEGTYSQNVHEVGRWIEPDGGSNFREFESLHPASSVIGRPVKAQTLAERQRVAQRSGPGRPAAHLSQSRPDPRAQPSTLCRGAVCRCVTVCHSAWSAARKRKVGCS